MRFFKSWLDYLYPPRCCLCRKLIGRGEFLCVSCLESISLKPGICPYCAYFYESEGECPECSHRKLYIDGMYALGPYLGNLKRLIQVFKYQEKKELAEFFAPLLIQGIISRVDSGQWRVPCGVVPIPLHITRKEQRGFNQAELLSEKIASHLNLPLMKVLSRVKDTESQARLGRRERISNLQGAFCLVEGEASQLKCLLVVDDIFTSGATINEAAGVLRQGGAKYLYAAVIGR
ncbi:ComF family protein [Candidatus Contubernalis alkaliaceticus]|uniref:ComF family protein n=1 Tax=Candidatus Contubernalis alkaliaceticus TaxID=338645 RepID=UPI001F4C2A94|nr:ComF family protein [Candidatus Contubernalis alkalaceticus]UNC90765.1 ComF family protein [Candidatus Contubernalis alkalaceticus]